MQYIFILLFSSMLISQTIDQKDLSIEPLRSILESASRTNQKVFVEDFTLEIRGKETKFTITAIEKISAE